MEGADRAAAFRPRCHRETLPPGLNPQVPTARSADLRGSSDEWSLVRGAMVFTGTFIAERQAKATTSRWTVRAQMAQWSPE